MRNAAKFPLSGRELSVLHSALPHPPPVASCKMGGGGGQENPRRETKQSRLTFIFS